MAPIAKKKKQIKKAGGGGGGFLSAMKKQASKTGSESTPNPHCNLMPGDISDTLLACSVAKMKAAGKAVGGLDLPASAKSGSEGFSGRKAGTWHIEPATSS